MSNRPSERKPQGAPSGPPPGFGFGRGPMGGMGMPVQKAKNFKGTIRRLLRYLRPYRAQLALVLLMAVLGTVFGIVSPKLLGQATTKLFEGSMKAMQGVTAGAFDFAGIGRILLVLAVLYVLSSLFMYFQQSIMVKVTQRIVVDLRRDVSEKLSRLPLSFYDGRPHGDIMSRASNDVDTISSTMQQSLTQMITSVVTLIGIVVMMLTISPLLTLCVVLTLPLSIIAMKNVAKRSQPYFVGQQRTIGELNGHVEEMLTGHTIVKAFGYERKSVDRFHAINERLYESGWKAQFISSIIMPLMGFVGNIGYVVVCVVGGILVTNGSIAIGDIQAFIQYSGQFSFPIAQVGNIANVIQSTVAAAERVFELLDEPEEKADPAKPAELASAQGNVRFEHVRFGYKTEEPLMEDLSIDVSKGQTIAIVGPTGAGKTTLVNLLLRFYEISGGRITIDGVDIREMKRSALHGLFGMVLQDTWLFRGTIRDNIGYGRAGATHEEIVQAARAAGADHFIRTLPDGYDTILNEEASNLSHGQKQLLTIARAVLADPAILILDEATSSVDTRTEVQIQKAMNDLMRGRTSFVIAHRLSTIRDADRILVMNYGSVIEQGSHEELLAAGGFYHQLYHSQFAASSATTNVG